LLADLQDKAGGLLPTSILLKILLKSGPQARSKGRVIQQAFDGSGQFFDRAGRSQLSKTPCQLARAGRSAAWWCPPGGGAESRLSFPGAADCR